LHHLMANYDNNFYPLAGLMEEASELSQQFTKVWLRGDNKKIDIEHAKKELGDVMWFVAEIATLLELDLAEVAQANLDKLADRASRGVIKGDGDSR